MGYLEKVLGDRETIVLKARRHWLAVVPTVVLKHCWPRCWWRGPCS